MKHSLIWSSSAFVRSYGGWIGNGPHRKGRLRQGGGKSSETTEFHSPTDGGLGTGLLCHVTAPLRCGRQDGAQLYAETTFTTKCSKQCASPHRDFVELRVNNRCPMGSKRTTRAVLAALPPSAPYSYTTRRRMRPSPEAPANILP